MLARDAHLSVTLLALMWCAWGAISLGLVPFRPFGPPNLFQAVAGAAAVAFFLSRRKRPNSRVAVAFSVIVVAYSVALLPWTAVVWCRFGRPWEAFTVPHVAMVVMALVVPRYFWLGAALIGLFAAESLFAYVYARQVGLAALLPTAEPFMSQIFAALGIGLLWLRRGRRHLALRHLRAQAESQALRELGPLFETVRDDLDRETGQISDELRRLATGSGQATALSRMSRALVRIETVKGTIEALAAGNGAAENQPVTHPATKTAPALSDAEQHLRDTDTQRGAILFTLIVAAAATLATISGLLAHQFTIAHPLIVAASLLGLVYLLSTRRRPSERRALAVTVVLWAVSLGLVSYHQRLLLARGRPFAPFVGQKLLMVCMPLVAASRLWLSLLLLGVTALEVLVFYFALHISTYQDILPLGEPWVTLLFLLVGIVASRMSEQRRAASVVVLRDELEVASLHRRAGLFLALRDQLNTPLQTLVLGAAQLEHGRPLESVARIRGGIDRLAALSRRLAQLDELAPPDTQRASLDSEAELSRRL
jgi:hypothetical protein